MLNINRKLAKLENEGSYIKVGLVGAGQMGRGMISQIESMKGMRVVVTADLFIDNITNAYKHAGIEANEIVVTEDAKDDQKLVQENKVVATTNTQLVTTLPEVDVVVDATGVPNIGL